MKNRKTIHFKIANEVVLIESGDLFLNQIDEYKWVIAQECDCTIDDIDIELIESATEVSEEIDVTIDGMIFWKSLEHRTIVGAECNLEDGSDEYLDAILNDTLHEHINFFTE